MKKCPYCNNPIEEHWPYCHHCNKPLIVNVRKQDHFTNEQFHDDNINYNFNYSYSNHEHEVNRSFYDLKLNTDEQFEVKIQKIDDTIDKYIKSGEPIGLLLFEKASLYYLKKNYNLALNTLENALNNFQAVDDILNIAISHNEMGLIQEDLGFYDNSIYHFEKSIELLTGLNDVNKLIKVSNNIANVYYLIKDIEHSYEYYNKALKMTIEANLISEEIKTSSNLVDILFNLKDYDKIDKILRRNLEYFRQIGDPYGIIITLTKIGKLNYLIGPDKFNFSLKFLLEALEMVNRIKINEKFSYENKAKLEW
ncbi:MAG: tetratricopeptide repeat protein, partial [Promethearchaeota archaeon]